MKRIVLAITGASGAVYARRLCEVLLAGGCQVHVITSPHGQEVMQAELGTCDWLQAGERLAIHPYDRMQDILASGSTVTDGMVICPCSVNTLAAVAAGMGDNLITRAAHVHLKQRKPLVLVVREMPVTAIDLENQLRLVHAGATIAPACPGFYAQPQTIADLVDFVVSRVIECLGIQHDMKTRYQP